MNVHMHRDTMRCIPCSVSWMGRPHDPCWSCGKLGVNPHTQPEAMLNVAWPSINSPYTETASNPRGERE